MTLLEPCHSAASICTLSSCFGEIVTCGSACFAPLLSSRAVMFPAGGKPDISAIVLCCLQCTAPVLLRICFRINRLGRSPGCRSRGRLGGPSRLVVEEATTSLLTPRGLALVRCWCLQVELNRDNLQRQPASC